MNNDRRGYLRHSDFLKLVDNVLSGYGLDHRPNCPCETCVSRHVVALINDLGLDEPPRPAEEIIARHLAVVNEQRSLAWCPRPPMLSPRLIDWQIARQRIRRELHHMPRKGTPQ